MESADSSNLLLRFVLAGCLNRDTVLPISGAPQIDVLGGNLAYAATGLRVWGGTGGLVARVGQEFPPDWIERLAEFEFDVSGIVRIPEKIDQRRFLAHSDSLTTHEINPVQHFADRMLPYPPHLLGYRADFPRISSRTEPSAQAIAISDVPKAYLDASAIHICPIDYLSHLMLISLFRQGLTTTLSLSPDAGYMSSSFWEEIPGLIAEVTIFITPEREVRNLFQGRQTDLWTMAGVLAGYGPDVVVVQTVNQGYFLLDRLNGRRWVVPEYQTHVVDPTGKADAFAGAFLVGYRSHYDPLEAALMGSIAASLVVEGSGVFYALDAMPGLIDARLTALRDLVREVKA